MLAYHHWDDGFLLPILCINFNYSTTYTRKIFAFDGVERANIQNELRCYNKSVRKPSMQHHNTILLMLFIYKDANSYLEMGVPSSIRQGSTGPIDDGTPMYACFNPLRIWGVVHWYCFIGRPRGRWWNLPYLSRGRVRAHTSVRRGKQ